MDGLSNALRTYSLFKDAVHHAAPAHSWARMHCFSDFLCFATQEAHQKLYAREEFIPKWSNFWHCQVGCEGDENEPLGLTLA